jgi:D-threo-aldose 1-dehydrogenase
LYVHDLDARLEEDNRHTRHVGGIAGAIDQLDSGGDWKVLADERSRGEISGIGFGINNPGFIPSFIEQFDPDMFLVAMPYTLMDQHALNGEFQLCAENGIGVVIGSVFSSRIVATGAATGAGYGYNPPPPDVVAKLKGIEAVCARHSVSIRAAALQFPLLHPVVAAIVPGAITPEQVIENAGLVNEPIPVDFWAELKNENLLRSDAPTA